MAQSQADGQKPQSEGEVQDALLVALRRAAVINAALIKLRRGQGGATPDELTRAVDDAIRLLERARSAIDIRSIEERLVATAFELADAPAPALPEQGAEADGPLLVEAIASLRADNA